MILMKTVSLVFSLIYIGEIALEVLSVAFYSRDMRLILGYYENNDKQP